MKSILHSTDMVQSYNYQDINNFVLNLRSKKDEEISCGEWIEFKHSHQVKVAQAFSYLRVTNETKQLFWAYFNEGLTPSCAKTYHEMTLEQDNMGENKNLIETLSNPQINPTDRQIYNLHSKWREENFGGRDHLSMIAILKEKYNKYKDMGIKIEINEDPLIIIILTPIMIRSHEREFAQEMVFIDSSGSCDQMNSCTTFVFAAHKIGAIPLAVILHTEQTEANYTLAFSLLKRVLHSDDFGKKGFPSVIMTDDSEAERNALSAVFPNSTLLLCTFHVCQAIWRWLWNADHKIEKSDRPDIMRKFQLILYSKTEEEFEDEYSSFIKDNLIVKYAKLLKHVSDFYRRKTEWAHAFRFNLITRGHNTNNYCESSIRIFKDLVLQRCKAFNSCALIDFVCNVFENYHKRRIISFANYRKNKNDLIYSKLKFKAKNLLVDKLTESQYLVMSESDNKLLYTVDMNIGMCDCIAGQGGKFCKHMCAVEENFHLLTTNCSPLLSPNDRRDLAELAVGDNIDGMFFEDMMNTSITCEGNSKRTSSSISTTNFNVKKEAAIKALSQNFSNLVEMVKMDTTPGHGVDKFNN
ncbi:hypothetical protein NQ317_017186 [Molorchus minor]|uniref:SWIM-type domain-containing protein n=1 Tax=Molorchus minor TaxID=1323400 RepID=A0ABQ9J0K9_9CUCU|nr:hypothetical protein NQ317_017186 [Molorchus minor]